MSTVAAPRRHALGLPPGSIRAVHVLGVVALVCSILLLPAMRHYPIPPYLIYLLFLVLGHYFAAHGNDIATKNSDDASPLHLPTGSVRLLILLMLGGTLGWLGYSDLDALKQHLEASLNELTRQPYMPIVILGGFFLGVVVRGLVGRENPPVWWQDIEAWISILALVGIIAAAIIHLIVGASMQEYLSLPVGEGVLGGVIAFYFGARS